MGGAVCVMKHYRARPELKAAIEGRFADEHDRSVAWQTVGLIRDVMPQISDEFNGELAETITQGA